MTQPDRLPKKRSKPVKTYDATIAAIASTKLEDGDVKDAVRLLCSDDRIAVPNDATLAELSRLHPPTPANRRAAPSSETPPLQVLSAAIRAAIQTFPNGSAAGPDGLRPQHLKDLMLAATDDNPLLMAVTDLINLLLEGKTPLPVRGSLFGATLLAVVIEAGWHPSHSSGLCLEANCCQGSLQSCKGRQCITAGATTAGLWCIWRSGSSCPCSETLP